MPIELVERLRQGDPTAFRELFVTHFLPLCAVARVYVKSYDVAQELVQDVFCQLWEQRTTLVVRGNLRAYLGAIVRNRALNAVKHQRVVERVEEIPFDGDYPGMSGPAMAADDALIQDEERASVERAIEALPERQRMVFHLRWRHHLSYAEIAELMGISIKGVEAARKRAIETLQQSLRGVFDP